MPENTFSGTKLYPLCISIVFKQKQKNQKQKQKNQKQKQKKIKRRLISKTTAATPLVDRSC